MGATEFRGNGQAVRLSLTSRTFSQALPRHFSGRHRHMHPARCCWWNPLIEARPGDPVCWGSERGSLKGKHDRYAIPRAQKLLRLGRACDLSTMPKGELRQIHDIHDEQDGFMSGKLRSNCLDDIDSSLNMAWMIAERCSCPS